MHVINDAKVEGAKQHHAIELLNRDRTRLLNDIEIFQISLAQRDAAINDILLKCKGPFRGEGDVLRVLQSIEVGDPN